MPSYSQKSKNKLATADDKLQHLFNEVIKHIDCTILEGHRSEKRQNQLLVEGRTKARFPHSNHNCNPSKAVDVVPYPIDWNDKKRFDLFASFVKGVAAGIGIKIRWGGDFKNFYDAPHFELMEN